VFRNQSVAKSSKTYVSKLEHQLKEEQERREKLELEIEEMRKEMLTMKVSVE